MPHRCKCGGLLMPKFENVNLFMVRCANCDRVYIQHKRVKGAHSMMKAPHWEKAHA